MHETYKRSMECTKSDILEYKNMNWSASDLIKQPARQMVFFGLKRQKCKDYEKPITEEQAMGTEYQEKISTSEFIEMRGTYNYKDHLIHYSFDEIKDDGNLIFIEHKNINDLSTLAEWYKQYCILQVAFYQSMATTVPDFYTASFMRKKGHEIKHISSKDRDKVFILSFGNDNEVKRYEIKVSNPEEIIKFYMNKLDHVVDLSYSEASIWGDKYKKKEFNKLQKYIITKRIENQNGKKEK